MTFHAGVLRERLAAANLSGLERRHQHALGVAVARRATQDTFVVRWDGLDPCLESDDLRAWPRDYRLRPTQGLWFNLAGRCALTPRSMREGLLALDPAPDASWRRNSGRRGDETPVDFLAGVCPLGHPSLNRLPLNLPVNLTEEAA